MQEGLEKFPLQDFLEQPLDFGRWLGYIRRIRRNEETKRGKITMAAFKVVDTKGVDKALGSIYNPHAAVLAGTVSVIERLVFENKISVGDSVDSLLTVLHEEIESYNKKL